MNSALIKLVIGTVLLLGSPGPAPIALAAVSATYGIRRGLPFYFGNLSGLLVAMIAAMFVAVRGIGGVVFYLSRLETGLSNRRWSVYCVCCLENIQRSGFVK